MLVNPVAAVSPEFLFLSLLLLHCSLCSFITLLTNRNSYRKTKWQNASGLCNKD